jgi:hypothetical protein
MSDQQVMIRMVGVNYIQLDLALFSACITTTERLINNNVRRITHIRLE